MSVDTLTLAQRLRAAELPATQAEAIAAAIGAAVLEGAATKDDLAATKAELKADFAGLRADVEQFRAALDLKVEQLRTEIERARNQMFIGMVGLAAVIIAAVRFL